VEKAVKCNLYVEGRRGGDRWVILGAESQAAELGLESTISGTERCRGRGRCVRRWDVVHGEWVQVAHAQAVGRGEERWVCWMCERS
jgi:hypothetical protein